MLAGCQGRSVLMLIPFATGVDGAVLDPLGESGVGYSPWRERRAGLAWRGPGGGGGVLSVTCSEVAGTDA